ncbi:hypothetical protein PSEWESI4_03963 [Pseudomonas carbonaria]|uniref:Uncharacterized protein n=1 Tax=Zestomonas carbonaria TaxID=2762745 RepID=A0A7U7ES17_9GAMM|nr:hypothetical protein PSEWESI4_03963 [Pseudomonas carbonaria]
MAAKSIAGMARSYGEGRALRFGPPIQGSLPARFYGALFLCRLLGPREHRDPEKTKRLEGLAIPRRP